MRCKDRSAARLSGHQDEHEPERSTTATEPRSAKGDTHRRVLCRMFAMARPSLSPVDDDNVLPVVPIDCLYELLAGINCRTRLKFAR